MVQVTFEISEHLLGQFYMAVGRALKRAQDESADNASGRDEPTVHDWGTQGSDSDAARMVWRKFSPRAQAVFSLLMDNPGVAMSADEIADKIGLSNGRHGLAGVVAWPSRQCAEFGLTPPYRYESPEAPGETGSYWMDAEMAALFSRARTEYQAKLGRPPTA
jgi:Family of unknown function (DUF6416)